VNKTLWVTSWEGAGRYGLAPSFLDLAASQFIIKCVLRSKQNWSNSYAS